jgi:hypothetical protein
VLKLPLLVDLQQKAGELVLSITSCPIIIILENVEVVLVTLTIDITFLPFMCMHFWVWRILRKGVCLAPMEWSAMAKILRNTDSEQ